MYLFLCILSEILVCLIHLFFLFQVLAAGAKGTNLTPGQHTSCCCSRSLGSDVRTPHLSHQKLCQSEILRLWLHNPPLINT